MPKRVVAISGALEKKSCTSGLLRACLQAQHPELAFKVFDISSFPIFNMDIVLDSGYPKEIQALRDAIFEADGMLYAVSQNNEKISAALKNAYDWISFSLDGKVPIKEKPSAVISVGMNGGQKAQNHFKRVIRYCKVNLMKQTVMVDDQPKFFDESGSLISEGTRGDIKTFLSHFSEFLSSIQA